MIDCEKETLILSDDLIFYTIEGEGEYIGQPSVFMRMSMCNLTCIGFASEDSPNGCDSYISWTVKNKKTFLEIFKMMEDNRYIIQLRHNAIWKLTGGEPLVHDALGDTGVGPILHRVTVGRQTGLRADVGDRLAVGRMGGEEENDCAGPTEAFGYFFHVNGGWWVVCGLQKITGFPGA